MPATIINRGGAPVVVPDNAPSITSGPVVATGSPAARTAAAHGTLKAVPGQVEIVFHNPA